MIDPNAPCGWPWHGLIAGGYVGSTGKAVNQPDHGWSWLIDMGLPAISRTPAQAAADAAAHYEWRNYALIAGGYLYDTHIGGASFIHVDEANIPWRITLSFSFPASNTLRVDVAIVRFGLFRDGVHSTLETNVSVNCEHIDLGVSSTGDDYSDRIPRLWDVWTNGARALLGVELIASDFYGDYYHLASVAELSISGTGGETGSGLSFELAELHGYSTLRWVDGTYGDENGEITGTWHRFAYYDSAGVGSAGGMQIYDFAWSDGYDSVQDAALRLLKSGTVMDELSCHRDFSGDTHSATTTWSGSIASHYSSPDAWRPWDGSTSDILSAFLNSNPYFAVAHGDTNNQPGSVGYQRINAHSHAIFYQAASSRDYASVVTPTGVISGPGAAMGDIYFAWQRKTGATSFAQNPICYV